MQTHTVTANQLPSGTPDCHQTHLCPSARHTPGQQIQQATRRLQHSRGADPARKEARSRPPVLSFTCSAQPGGSRCAEPPGRPQARGRRHPDTYLFFLLREGKVGLKWKVNILLGISRVT